MSTSTTLPSEDLHSLQLNGAIGGYTFRGNHVGVVIHVYAPVGKQWHEAGKKFDHLMFGEQFARGQDFFRLEDLIARAVEGIQKLATQLNFKLTNNPNP